MYFYTELFFMVNLAYIMSGLICPLLWPVFSWALQVSEKLLLCKNVTQSAVPNQLYFWAFCSRMNLTKKRLNYFLFYYSGHNLVQVIMTRFLILWSEICDKVQYRQITLQNILKSEVNSKTKEKKDRVIYIHYTVLWFCYDQYFSALFECDKSRKLRIVKFSSVKKWIEDNAFCVPT